MFARQRGLNLGSGGRARPLNPIMIEDEEEEMASSDVRRRLGPVLAARPTIRDWDAPEEEADPGATEEDRIAASLHRVGAGNKRGRSPLGEVVTSDSEEWSKRLKRPRMTMVADQVGKEQLPIPTYIEYHWLRVLLRVHSMDVSV